ncbi:MAG: hypothetical protein A2172_05395 [Candidatus Woykebacteria bacterium RBG_13_40_15]|uniref:Uncharacterized protein n=1 Tax=Candidatus Woykebacteria bacterium RBG_13_40_15 TaxID=1802593 RepID=A0A1G1W832_9BACT|nr:MAG: hypothetical protein A2172_05395 [Candidatus Woykebacteria bacterium RBG_13_40_15]
MSTLFSNPTIQTFDDSLERKKAQKQRGYLARIFPFDLETIEKLQSEGAGVFFVPNPQVDLNQRGILNTKEFKFLSLDLDVTKESSGMVDEDIKAAKKQLEAKLLGLEIKPNVVIETKNGLQPVWEFANPKQLTTEEERVDADTLYERMVLGVTKVLGHKSEGDSLSRVIRYPKTKHLKDPNNPHTIDYKETNSTCPTFETFMAAYPPASFSEIKTPYAEIIKGVDIGDRFKLGLRLLGRWLKGSRLDEFETVVWPMFKIWNQTCNPPKAESMVREHFEGIAKKETAKRQEEVSNSAAIRREPFEFNPILLSSLTEDDYLDIDWIWEGFIAKGHITLLSALWKSGKTTLVAELLKAIQEAKPLAGQTTKKVRTLIVTEESKNMWYRRKEDHDLTLDIWIVPRPVNRRLSYIEWVKFINEVLDFAKNEGIELVVLDTISTFWSVTNENDASDVGAALLPLTSVTEEGMGVLMVHHFRKSGGEEGTAARGSGALGSYVDILVDFSRMDKEDPKSTKRVIKTYSRFDETPIEVVLEYLNDEYVTLGTIKEVRREAKLGVVINILEKKKEGLTVSEIVENWDEDLYGKPKKKRSVSDYISELLEKGVVVNAGEKMVGKTLAPVYCLAENNASKTSIGDTSHFASDIEPKNWNASETGNARVDKNEATTLAKKESSLNSIASVNKKSSAPSEVPEEPEKGSSFDKSTTGNGELKPTGLFKTGDDQFERKIKITKAWIPKSSKQALEKSITKLETYLEREAENSARDWRYPLVDSLYSKMIDEHGAKNFSESEDK